MFRQNGFILLGMILICLLAGCSRPSTIDQYQAGGSSRYVSGIPSFDIEAVPSLPGQAAGLDLFLSVPSTSLTFEKSGDQFWALHEMRVALHSAKDETFVLERSWTDTTAVSTYGATQRHDPFLYRRHVDVPPGEYDVEVTLENLSSARSDVRRQVVEIHDPSDISPFLGKVLVRARTDRGAFLPVVSFHVPSGLDSLECVTTLHNLNPVRPSLATLELVRYRTDTLAALPPWALTAVDLPLGFGMVTFDKPETVLVRTEPIAAGTAEALLDMGLRGLPAGNYKAGFQVQTPAVRSLSRDTLLRMERFISLGGPTFPRPSTLTEMIESMVYIARRHEMELLRESPTPEVARTRFDSLWLSMLHGKGTAASQINRYYSRVEEANRRFTTTKEGWRTDQGMLYIVLGPPVEVMDTKDQQVWYYDLRGNDAANIFTFQRRFVRDEQIALESYTLYRQAYYENLWTRMVEKWRSGEVF